MFLVMGDTPVALCCLRKTNRWPILGEMAGQGREPLVLETRARGGVEVITIGPKKTASPLHPSFLPSIPHPTWGCQNVALSVCGKSTLAQVLITSSLATTSAKGYANQAPHDLLLAAWLPWMLRTCDIYTKHLFVKQKPLVHPRNEQNLPSLVRS